MTTERELMNWLAKVFVAGPAMLLLVSRRAINASLPADSHIMVSTTGKV
jgi:hypothetical protein